MAPIQDDDDSSSGVTDPNRREFLLNAGSTMAGGVIAACAPAYASSTAAPTQEAVRHEHSASEGAVPITLRINGKDHSMRIDPRTTLLDCIRETVALTGTKKGCDHGQCGACTVHVNGRRALPVSAWP